MALQTQTNPTTLVNLQGFFGIKAPDGTTPLWTKIDWAGDVMWHLNEGYLSQEYGGVKYTNAQNLVFTYQPRNYIQDGTTKVSDMKTNLPKIEAGRLMVHRVRPFFQTGYQVSWFDKKTSDEWSGLLDKYERSIVENQLWFTHATALDVIATTALATGNFKVLPDLIANFDATVPSAAEQAEAARKTNYQLQRLKLIFDYKKRQANSFALGGMPAEDMRIEAIPELKLSMLSTATTLNVSNLALEYSIIGEINQWMGFRVATSVMLGNRLFMNKETVDTFSQYTDTNASTAVTPNTVGLLNRTSVNFDFSNIVALMYYPGSLYLVADEPMQGQMMNQAPFINDPDDITMAYRSYQFFIEGFVRPSFESSTMLIFTQEPTEAEVAKAQKKLYGLYPELYKGFSTATDTNVATGDGTATYAAIIAAAKNYESPSPISNPYGLKDVNFSGVIVPNTI